MYYKYQFFTPFISIPPILQFDNGLLYLVRFYSKGYGDWQAIALCTSNMLSAFDSLSNHDYAYEILSELDRDLFVYFKEALNPEPYSNGFYLINTNEVLFIMTVLKNSWENKIHNIKKRYAKRHNTNPESIDVTPVIKPQKEHINRSVSYEGYVYLLKMLDRDYWKIGRTSNPQKRMDRFDVKLPFAVECEHLIKTENMYQLERELHIKYASKRINGEWFALEQADIEYIKTL